MNDTGSMEGQGQSRTSMRGMRWLLVGLGTLLAVILIAKGVLIIGGIIAVMVVVRTVMLVQTRDGYAVRQGYGPPRS